MYQVSSPAACQAHLPASHLVQLPAAYHCCNLVLHQADCHLLFLLCCLQMGLYRLLQQIQAHLGCFPSGVPSHISISSASIITSNLLSCAVRAITSDQPSDLPSDTPSDVLSAVPSNGPNGSPSDMPSRPPSSVPSNHPSHQPRVIASSVSNVIPRDTPFFFHSDVPSGVPSNKHNSIPSSLPSFTPSALSNSFQACFQACFQASQPVKLPEGYDLSGCINKDFSDITKNISKIRCCIYLSWEICAWQLEFKLNLHYNY